MTTQPTFNEALREIIDYTRFDQQWAATQVEHSKNYSEHQNNCGVCNKMRQLEDQAIESIISLIKDRVVGENEADEHKKWDCPCGVTHEMLEQKDHRNNLRSEMRAILEGRE